MNVQLEQLIIRNFKGMEDFTFNPKGKNVDIFGDNATMKTTIYDAFLWALTDKDSQGKSDFEIKPKTPDGEIIWGKDVEVIVTLNIDGQLRKLRKAFKEVWKKSRGKAQKEFTGNSTEYAFDDEPVKKKEWTERIAGIIDENLLKLLTNPFHFANMKWTDRRAILLEFAGDISDEDVIASAETDLSRIPELTAGHSVQSKQKILESRKKEVEKELKDIPARIDEWQKSLSEEDPRSLDEIDASIAGLQEKIKNTRSFTDRHPTRVALEEVENKIDRLKGCLNEAIEREKKQMSQEYDEQAQKVRDVREALADTDSRIKQIEREKTMLEKYLDECRKKYKQSAEKQAPEETVCPTCGQNLPEGQIEETRKRFNAEWAQALSELNEEGQELSRSIKEKAKVQKDLLWKKDELSKSLEGEESKLDDLKIQQQEPVTFIDLEAELKKWKNRALELRQELQEAPASDTAEIEAELQQEQAVRAAKTETEKAKARIKALKAEEKSMAREYEVIEEDLDLLKEFTFAKARLMEAKINGRFNLATFRMFETHLNGNIEEKCEILYRGISFSRGLNRGAQINVGLDIIHTLSRHYDIAFPIFIDNAEAVTRLCNTGSQVIRLFVKYGADKLEIHA